MKEEVIFCTVPLCWTECLMMVAIMPKLLKYFILPVFLLKKCEKLLHSLVFYAPNFGEVEGAYWFGPVRPSVRLSVTLWQLRNSGTAYARILKLYMWHVHEK